MANVNSNLVANLVADPPVLNSVGVSGGRVRVATDGIVIVPSLDGGDKISLVRLPSNARIQSIQIKGQSIGSVEDADLSYGVYNLSGAVIDEDAYALDSQLLRSDVVIFTDVLGFGLTATVSSSLTGKRVWEVAGLSSDPGDLLEIAATLTQADSSTGITDTNTAFSFKIEYTVD